MFTIGQSRRVRGAAGDPLPAPFRAFDDIGFTFRRGGFCLIVAGPGTGKSALALNIALAFGSKHPGMYFSADSDAFEQSVRSFCLLTGSQREVGERFARGRLDPSELSLVELVQDVPIRFNYDASPTLDTISNTMDAFDELYGEYPHYAIVDNVTNVQNGTADNAENPFGGLETFMEYLNTMARDTQTCVIGLHHTTGTYNDGIRPIPLSGVKGQITRVPQQVLTLFRPTDGQIGVSPVKNRGGQAAASGHRYAVLDFDGSSMTIRDPDFSRD
jgi:RecA-family ATPase